MKLHVLVAELETARLAVEGGATVVQWRLKNVPRVDVVERGRAARSLCARHGVTFVVNDDIEAAIVPHYVQSGIVERSPFATIDERGVGELVQIAIERGRAARPGLEVGICGEHGGDATSIRFFDRAGLDYVSCSPFRVPIARVAAAQAAGARH